MVKKTVLLLSLFFLTGFFIKAQTGVTIIDSIFSNGIYRTYRLYRPNLYTGATAVPLVINLHGYTSNATAQQVYGNFMPISDTANFLIVHPQGTKDGTNQPYWNAGISSLAANDLLFISQLIDSLKATFNIDLNSVYSTGISNGSFMSNYLACTLSNKIAAIAGVAGTMFTNWNNSCNPARPIPVMHIHGTADGTVPYNGNSTMIAVDTLIKTWCIKNNCNLAPTLSAVPNISTTDGCTADRYVYSGGTNNSSVELYRINGGGHTWPGATFITGVTNQDFSASIEIWRFFRKYKLNQFTAINENYTTMEKLTFFPNPANDAIFITSDTEIKTIITDLNGNICITETSQNKIDINHLVPGMYFVFIKNSSTTITKKLIKCN